MIRRNGAVRSKFNLKFKRRGGLQLGIDYGDQDGLK